MTVSEERLKDLPTGPGCYIFLDPSGRELYVGKAKNLRRRVRSYFVRHRDHPARTLRLAGEAADVRVVETGSEVEALLLENQLIKELKPDFNVRLKDDKTYPLLAITRDPFPRVFLTRDREVKGVDLYGPFASMTELKRAYHFLMRTFQFRNCTLDIQESDRRRASFRPCLNYHIKRCSAPCTTRINRERYAEDIKSLRALLTGRGGTKALADGLQERMREASLEMRYEDAARYRDQLTSLGRLKERGRLRDWADPAAPVIDHEQALQKLADDLGLAAPPRVIEGFDIAHLQGSSRVAAMVQFVDGLPNRDGYRRYKVQHGGDDPTNDDFAAMHEVVGRRYRRLVDEGVELPGLILIDGGLGQVHAAEKALREAGIEVPALVGLAKREETLVRGDGSELLLGRRHPGLKLVMFVRDEAHRFSRRYHHLLEAKRLRG